MRALFENEVRPNGPKEEMLSARLELRTRLTLIIVSARAGNGTPVTTLLDELRTDAIRSLGKDARFTLAVRQFIADRALEQGDIAHGRALLEELLQDRTRVLGAEHSSSIRTGEQLDALAESVRGDGVARTVTEFSLQD